MWGRATLAIGLSSVFRKIIRWLFPGGCSGVVFGGRRRRRPRRSFPWPPPASVAAGPCRDLVVGPRGSLGEALPDLEAGVEGGQPLAKLPCDCEGFGGHTRIARGAADEGDEAEGFHRGAAHKVPPDGLNSRPVGHGPSRCYRQQPVRQEKKIDEARHGVPQKASNGTRGDEAGGGRKGSWR